MISIIWHIKTESNRISLCTYVVGDDFAILDLCSVCADPSAPTARDQLKKAAGQLGRKLQSGGGLLLLADDLDSTALLCLAHLVLNEGQHRAAGLLLLVLELLLFLLTTLSCSLVG